MSKGWGFNNSGREGAIEEMTSTAYDLLVVGGGITGAGVARDAALRGLRVALVEAGDLAGGTSGRTSKLIHGGLRYLRQGHVRMVWQAAHERAALQRLAPHLVTLATFLLPIYGRPGMGYWSTALGLWLYDRMAGRGTLGIHRMVGRTQALALEPGLNPKGLRGAALFSDCVVDDARLVLLTARDAWRWGARIATRCILREFLREGGRIVGGRLEDLEGGLEFDLSARVVVAAGGPWSDGLAALAGAPPVLRPTKGIHLIIPRSRLGHDHPMAMWNPTDGRLFFILPWGNLSVVGTTDTPFKGDPAEVRATEEDVDYLLRALGHFLPSAPVGRSDVVATYAGVRPLVRGGKDRPGDVPREHRIQWVAPGLVMVYGGKLTTYRAMAEDVVDRVLGELGMRRSCKTKHVQLQGPLGPARVEALRSSSPLPSDVTDHLIRRHGADAERIVGRAVTKGLELRLVPGLPYIEAEVLEAAEDEMVLHLEDFMERRTHISLEATDHGLGAAGRITFLLGGALGWTAERCREEVASYRERVDARETWRKKGS